MRPGLAAGAVLFLSFFSLVTCSESPSELEPPEATTIELSASTLEVDDGGSRSLDATVRDQYGDPMPGAVVEWSSTNTAIASVADGLVTGNYPGETTVQATSGSAVAAATVIVVRVPTAMELVSGADQQGTVGEALPDSIAVRVLDRHDEAVTGATVRFALSSGSGEVGATQVATDANGLAATDWTLGTIAGEQVLEITCDRLTTVVHEVHAVALAAAPDRVAVVGGDGQTGTVAEALTDSIAVQVFDAYDNPVPGAVVAWDPEDYGAAIHPVVSTAAEDGIARASWTLGTVAGAQSTQAVIGSVAAAVLNATAYPGDPDELVVTRGSDQTLPAGAVADTLEVKAVDRWGNAVHGVEVSWIPDLASGSVAVIDALTSTVDGTANAVWRLGPATGEQVVRARSPGIPEVLFRATAVNGPEALTPISGGGQAGVYGEALEYPLVVSVTDGYGNPVEGALITWSIAAGNGAVDPAFNRTDPSGLASARFQLGTTGVDSVMATTLDNATTPTMYTARFGAEARQKAVLLELSDTGFTALGDTIALTLTGRDANGDPLDPSTLALATLTSSDPDVVRVLWDGRVASGANGEAVVTAALDGVVAEANVRVEQQAAFMEVLNELFYGEVLLRVRDRKPLELNVYDANEHPMETVDLRTRSDNPVVAEVVEGLEGGFVFTADYPGYATITLLSGTASTSVDVRVAAGEAIAANLLHTCAIAPSGEAYCWGHAIFGLLGNGANGDYSESSPVPVAGGLRFRQLSAGYDYNCGVTYDSRLYCWGYNAYGQIGDGSDIDRPEPVWVMDGVERVAAALLHTCALTTDHRAFCWGTGNRLGTGVNPNAIIRRPVEVYGGLRFQTITAGETGTCALDLEGRAYCWGLGYYGMLGDGESQERFVPTPVAGGHRFKHIDAGRHHVCGVAEDGTAYCWGYNGYGQLGNASTENAAVPVPVASDSSFIHIDAGYQHTCAITTGLTPYCWGWNSSGQLGDGTRVDRHSPVAVYGSNPYTWISAGYTQTCALSAAPIAHCWGSHGHGELGIGGETVGVSTMPVQIMLPPGVIFAWVPPEPVLWQPPGPVASIDG